MPSVLIVDDEGAMCESLSMLLRMEGYDVDCTTSASAAVARVARSRPDVIVTDMRMPDLNGIEFLAAAKSRSPFTEIIVMTALCDRRKRRQRDESRRFRLHYEAVQERSDPCEDPSSDRKSELGK